VAARGVLQFTTSFVDDASVTDRSPGSPESFRAAKTATRRFSTRPLSRGGNGNRSGARRMRSIIFGGFLGLLVGGAVGRGVDHVDHRSVIAGHRDDARALVEHVTKAERSLLSALVQGPSEVDTEVQSAKGHLLDVRDGLNELNRSATTPGTVALGEGVRANFDRFVESSDVYLAALRVGDFGGALRVAAALTVRSTTDPEQSQISAEITDLANRISQETATGWDATFGLGGLGAVVVMATVELRRRRRRATARARLTTLAGHLEVVQPAIVVLDRLGHIEHVSAAAAVLIGVDSGSELGVSLVGAAGPEFAELARATGDRFPIDITLTRRARPLHIEATTPVAADDGGAVLWVLHDVTDERSREGELTRKAFHDPLTLLPNRERFRQLLQEMLETSDPDELAVVFIDLDGFKHVNDTYGHEFGDHLLVEVTVRLSEIVHAGDLVGRLGGDEFALILRSTRPRYAEVIAEQIVHELAEPFVIDGRTTRIGGSVGYTQVRPDSSVEELLQEADVAMYTAKDRGKGCTAKFHPEMLVATRRRMAFERELHGVASSGQLRLLYQPVVELATRKMVGIEALVRWLHPERGLVSPLDFITAAEANGSINDIGRWVLRTGLTEFALLPSSYALRLNVNVSPRQLAEPDFVASVAAEIDRSGLDPSLVTLEVTESLLLGDVEQSIERLHELKAIGVRLAIDDFGTGYSSLSYLARLPVDVVKIDKSFVDDLVPADEHSETGASQRAFIGALVSLAHACNLTVVAEGIEHEHQVEALRSLGCGFGQGYLFAKPLPATSLAAAISPEEAFGAVMGMAPASSGDQSA
jgi:diguanylate cyclase (GGDEF)-like protein